MTTRKERLAMALQKFTAAMQAWITLFVATIYNLVLAAGVLNGMLPFKDYIFAVGPVNTMIMAFWLGGELALRDPKRRSDDPDSGESS